MPGIRNADELHFREANEAFPVTRSSCDLASVPQPAGGTAVNAASLSPSHALTNTCL